MDTRTINVDEALRAARAAADQTQATAAAEMGISHNRLWSWEHGVPPTAANEWDRLRGYISRHLPEILPQLVAPE